MCKIIIDLLVINSTNLFIIRNCFELFNLTIIKRKTMQIKWTKYTLKNNQFNKIINNKYVYQ